MTEQTLTQPLPEENTEENRNPETEKKPPETKFGKTVAAILEFLEKLTGSKEKSKKLLIIIIFSLALFLVALLTSLFRRPNSLLPEPVVEPFPTPVEVTPTRILNPENMEIEKLREEIESFDTEKKDILAPNLDFAISI